MSAYCIIFYMSSIFLDLKKRKKICLSIDHRKVYPQRKPQEIKVQTFQKYTLRPSIININ